MKRVLIFTGWYPTPEQPLNYPFVSQQVKVLKEALPNLSGEPWEIIVWHEALPVDITNRFLRNKKTTKF